MPWHQQLRILTYLGNDFRAPLLTTCILVGSTIGCVIITAIDKKRYMPEFRRLKKENSDAKVPPEERLWNMMIGAPLLAISLFWFGWTARPSIHWISPIAAEAMFSCGNLLIFVSTLVYLADCFGAKYGASATSSNTFFRYLVATVFPLFANQLYEGLGVGWASSLLGFLAAVLAPIPFLFFRYGPMLRSRSTYVSGE